MKDKNKPARETKKKPGVFGEKKRRNKARRQYVIATLLGGPEWAEQCVREGRIKIEGQSND